MATIRYVSRGSQKLVTSYEPKSANFTSVDFARTLRMVVNVEKGPIYYTVDGSLGRLLRYTGAVFNVWGETDMRSFSFYSATDKDAVIVVRLEGSGGA